MSANPPKRDAWPPWSDVRFVLVRSVGKLRPCRGLVLDVKRDGAGRKAGWEAMVVYFDDTALRPMVKMDWFPTTDLIPVDVDPNLLPRGTSGRR